MSKQRTEPEFLESKLNRSVLLRAKRNCTCRGRGYNWVEFGVTKHGKKTPIEYGMPYFRTRE